MTSQSGAVDEFPAETDDLSSRCGAAAFFVADTPHTGRGLFTKRAFHRGDRVFTITGNEHHWASRTEADARSNPNYYGIRQNVWLDPAPPYLFVNHSCHPNLGVLGERDFVALREIEPGDELTVDYSITTDELRWAMPCLCQAPGCRRIIRSIQYLPHEVFNRYLPHVNPYFQDVFRGSRGLSSVEYDECEKRNAPADHEQVSPNEAGR